MSRIDDFGEKIHGARKDAHAQWVDRVNDAADSGLESFISDPLSVSWPAPNYDRMVRENTLPRAVIDWMRAAREELGRKPGRYRVATWAARAQVYLSVAQMLMEKDWQGQSATQVDILTEVSGLVEQAADRTDVKISRFNADSVLDSLDSIYARALAYERWGHKTSLSDKIEFSRYRNVVDGDFRNAKTVYSAVIKASTRERGRRHISDNWANLLVEMEKDPLIEGLRLGENSPAKKAARASKKAELAVVGYRNQTERFVAVKIKSNWVELEKFPSKKEATEAFLNADNQERWQAAVTSWKQQSRARTRGNENAPRDGVDWRGGGDVTPELFSDTFGFRGVQFGNYVENERRKDDLNDAYDALMDMASVLNIAPKALSLDGTLGLAFGARGKGGLNPASAHYEPDHKVINLTKTNGAGSLAHEWFHAFDNYIADTTLEARHGKTHTYFTEGIASNKYNYIFTQDESNPLHATADELSRVINILKERSVEMDKRRSGKAYWSKEIEIAARAFEAGIKEALLQKGCRNDYLVNVLDEALWDGFPTEGMPELIAKSSYPYPKEDEKAQNATHILALVEAMCNRSETFSERFTDSDNHVEQEKAKEKKQVGAGEQLSFAM